MLRLAFNLVVAALNAIACIIFALYAVVCEKVYFFAYLSLVYAVLCMVFIYMFIRGLIDKRQDRSKSQLEDEHANS